MGKRLLQSPSCPHCFRRAGFLYGKLTSCSTCLGLFKSPCQANFECLLCSSKTLQLHLVSQSAISSNVQVPWPAFNTQQAGEESNPWIWALLNMMFALIVNTVGWILWVCFTSINTFFQYKGLPLMQAEPAIDFRRRRFGPPRIWTQIHFFRQIPWALLSTDHPRSLCSHPEYSLRM